MNAKVAFGIVVGIVVVVMLVKVGTVASKAIKQAQTVQVSE